MVCDEPLMLLVIEGFDREVMAIHRFGAHR